MIDDHAALERVLRHRRSVRVFTDEAVSEADLRALIDAATWAPSAGNRQDWRFQVVRDRERIAAIGATVDAAWRRIADASGGIGDDIAAYAQQFSWLGSAPAVVAVAVRPPPAWLVAATGSAATRIAGGAASAAMAVQNLLLAADARGLGACVCTAPIAAESDLRPLLGCDRRHELVALVAVGHPAGPPPTPPPRRPLHDIIHDSFPGKIPHER